MARLPLMPIERSSRAQILFLVLFMFIYFTQIFVVNPNLDVWYFLFSTTLVSAKLLLSFVLAVRSKPGYLERGQGEEFEMENLLKHVPSEKICPFCKVIKTPRSKHCATCNKCVDRFE